jgi:hypothetical protein
MEIKNDQGIPYFNNDQKIEIEEIIGDILSEEQEKDGNLHYADIIQASIDIATLLSGSAVFLSMSFEAWRITHTKKVKEIRERALQNGVTLREEAIDEIIKKVGEYLGYKYPPIEINEVS